MEEKKEALPEEETCEITGGVESKPEAESESPKGSGPEEGEAKEEERVRKILEEARRRCEEIPEEELHPDYKKLIAISSSPSVDEGEEKEVIRYARCGECGVTLPYDQLYDNGNYLVCSKCL